jgi:hypothetical protein
MSLTPITPPARARASEDHATARASHYIFPLALLAAVLAAGSLLRVAQTTEYNDAVGGPGGTRIAALKAQSHRPSRCA